MLAAWHSHTAYGPLRLKPGLPELGPDPRNGWNLYPGFLFGESRGTKRRERALTLFPEASAIIEKTGRPSWVISGKDAGVLVYPDRIIILMVGDEATPIEVQQAEIRRLETGRGSLGVDPQCCRLLYSADSRTPWFSVESLADFLRLLDLVLPVEADLGFGVLAS